MFIDISPLMNWSVEETNIQDKYASFFIKYIIKANMTIILAVTLVTLWTVTFSGSEHSDCSCNADVNKYVDQNATFRDHVNRTFRI